MTPPVADGGDAVQGAFETGAVISIHLANARDNIIYLGAGDLGFGERHLAIDEKRRGHAPEVEDDLEQVVGIIRAGDRLGDGGREYPQQRLQVIGNASLGHLNLFYLKSGKGNWGKRML